MALRDEKADIDRFGAGNSNRADHMIDMDFRVGTLADEKNHDPKSVGTASDFRGATDGASDATPGGRTRLEDM